MTAFRNVLTAAAALGVVIAAAPAQAQGWYDDGYNHHRRHHPERYYDRPYRGYDVDAGVTDIAICPPGYHLGRSGRLCWPD
jgi:hypothetical protein